jgi:acyl carrier protein
MTIEAFIAELEASLGEFAQGKLRPDTRFRDLVWWDSLAYLTTLTVFDACFGRQISAQELAACQTIADIYAQAKR